jgi:outer membrane protein assembly factor BamB
MKRIRILVLILCACFVSVALGQQPAGKGRADWTEFHRTNMQRWNPYEHVLNVNNVGSLYRKWSFKTGNFVYAAPAVNGVVYVGSWDHNVYALSTRSCNSPLRCSTTCRQSFDYLFTRRRHPYSRSVSPTVQTL